MPYSAGRCSSVPADDSEVAAVPSGDAIVIGAGADTAAAFVACLVVTVVVEVSSCRVLGRDFRKVPPSIP